jgi:hypothetical protein
MNFKAYFVGVWQGIVGKNELQVANEAGQKDGQALGTAYTSGVAEGFSFSLEKSLPMLLGHSPIASESEEPIDEGEIVNKKLDLQKMSKSQLVALAKEYEIPVDGRKSQEFILAVVREYEPTWDLV